MLQKLQSLINGYVMTDTFTTGSTKKTLNVLRYSHCPHSRLCGMRSKVYVTVHSPSVCLSQHGPVTAGLLLLRAGDINRLLHGSRVHTRAVPRFQRT